MQTITLGQLVAAVNGRLLGTYADLNTPIDLLDTDSRAVREGAVFLPIVGERFDGHTYIDSALEKGAAGTLTDRELDSYRPDKFYVKVENTELALRDLAVWYKSLFPIPFVAVTGSVGKTTAKDMIACVLEQKFRVLKTEGNFNNNLGLPLTVLRLTDEHEMCVLKWAWIALVRSIIWPGPSSPMWVSSPTSAMPISSAWAAGRTSSRPSARCCPM